MLAMRRFGAGLVLPALAVVLAAAAARAQGPAPIDKLLPNDTEMVFTIKVKAILDSPLARKTGLSDTVKDLVEGIAEVQDVLKDLDFNPLTDIDQITAAVCSGSDPEKGLIILRGKFAVEKFRARAEQAAKDNKDILSVHKAPDGMGGQHTYYEVTTPGSSTSLYVAFAGKTTLVAGAAKDYVLDALDKETGKKKTQLKSKEVEELLGRLDPNLMIAVAVPAKTVGANQQLPAQAKELLDKMTDIVFGVEFDKDVKAKLVVTAKKTSDAEALNKSLNTSLNTGLALLAVLANEQQQLEPVLDIVKSIKPRMKDKTITIDVQVSGDLVEKLLKNAK